MARAILMTVLCLVSAACFSSHARTGDDDSPCAGAASLVCVSRTSGPCSPWERVPATCAADGTRHCEPDATPYVGGSRRACAPFDEGLASLTTLGPTLERGDACVYLANGDVTHAAGPLEHMGIRLPRATPFGSCPSDAGEPLSLLDRTDIAEGTIVDLMDTLRVGDRYNSLYRLFVEDPEAVFGVRALGGGVVRHAPDGTFRPDRALAFDDGLFRAAVQHGDHVYIYRCGLAPGLVGPCAMSRSSTEELLEPERWVHWNGALYTNDPDEAAFLFEAGPHVDVTYDASRDAFVALTVEGFGSEVLLSTASRPEGPWTPHRRVARCALPEGDSEAFCDSVRMRPELADPTRPNDLVLSHRVGTLAEDWMERVRERPEAYRGQMVFSRLP